MMHDCPKLFIGVSEHSFHLSNHWPSRLGEIPKSDGKRIVFVHLTAPAENHGTFCEPLRMLLPLAAKRFCGVSFGLSDANEAVSNTLNAIYL